MTPIYQKLVRTTAAIALLTGLLAGCGGASAPVGSGSGAASGGQVVNILSCNYEEQQAIQLAWLRSKFPDAQIHMTYLSSGKLAARVQAEGRDTEADILLSLSSGYAHTLKQAGLLRPFTPHVTYREEFADPDSVVLPNGIWAGAILVNVNELQRLGLPEPASYEDLLDPIYKGHIVMSHPNSSSTGYFFVLGLLNRYGEEAGWAYFDRLRDNIMLFGESGSVPSSMVEMGEAAIGLGMDYEGLLLESQGKPVKTLFATEGAPYDYDTVLLVNRKAEPSLLVLEVLEAITSPEGNAVFNNYNLTVLEGEKNRGSYPGHFQLLDMEGISDPELKTRISAAWSDRYE